MSVLPSFVECIELLRNAGCEEEVVQHCIIVTRLAVKIAKLCNADVELVETGAMLHDIGRSKTHGIKHGVFGAEIAKKLDLPNEVVGIIENHLGAGIVSEDAVELGLPPDDYIPKTLEEKIVAHADNLIEGDKKQTIEEAVKEEIRKGNDKVADRMRLLHDELSKKCGIDLDEIKLD